MSLDPLVNLALGVGLHVTFLSEITRFRAGRLLSRLAVSLQCNSIYIELSKVVTPHSLGTLFRNKYKINQIMLTITLSFLSGEITCPTSD